jgi:photosystem II stability/assembly factor-like uncharacterized protein
MKGDFTRTTFRPEKHYSGVRLQQGRVQLDADFNEQVDIEAHRDRMTAHDVIGPHGVPDELGGFEIFPTLRLAAIDAAGPVVRAVGDRGANLVSTDSGSTWTSQAIPPGTTGDLQSVDVVTNDVAFVVGVGAGGAPLILKTTDGGGSWSALAPPSGTTGTLRGVSFFDSQRGCAVGDAGLILVTTNGGSSWARKTVAAVTERLHAVHFLNATHAWAVGDGGRILVTIDGGSTWEPQQIAPGFTAALRAVHFVGTATGWAVGDGATILSTSNGGATWAVRAAPSGVTETLRGVDAENSSTVWTVGDRGTVLRSANGGATWQATASVGWELTGIRIIGGSVLVCGDFATLARATVGASPSWTHATMTASPVSDLGLTAGRIYVAGILCENDQPIRYTTQPDLPDAPVPSDPGRYLAYLDVWQRHVTALERPDLREVALGGPDTATRTQTVWQVRLVGVPAGTECPAVGIGWAPTAPSSGRMRAHGEPAGVTSAECLVPTEGGYQRLENQLYRVEVLEPGTAGAAMFAWSRDNGTMVSRLVRVDDLGGGKSRLTVSDPGRDGVIGFAGATYVELSDERRVLLGEPVSSVYEVESVVENAITIRHSPGTAASLGEFVAGALVRRWDGFQRVDADGWIGLEGGVEVQFAPGGYSAGDYWTIPARTNTASVEWPSALGQPQFELRHGTEHHYCPLAVLDRDGGGAWIIVGDCRPMFTSLTGQTRVTMAGGDGQELVPGTPQGLLPYPLEVAAMNGRRPWADATIRFEVEEGGGTLALTGQPPVAPPGTRDVATDARGIGACDWRLVESAARHRVVARLLDSQGQPLDAPIHFSARVATAATGEDDGIHIIAVRVNGGERDLRNDDDVNLTELANGIVVSFDKAIDDVVAREGPKVQPVMVVRVDLPYPEPLNAIVAFQPVFLRHHLEAHGDTLVWRPWDAHFLPWIRDQMSMLPEQDEMVTHLLAHLELRGNFIWDAEDPSVFLDGDSFGTRGDDGRIDILPTEAGALSGDGRRGGDFRMWFWLAPEVLKEKDTDKGKDKDLKEIKEKEKEKELKEIKEVFEKPKDKDIIEGPVAPVGGPFGHIGSNGQPREKREGGVGHAFIRLRERPDVGIGSTRAAPVVDDQEGDASSPSRHGLHANPSARAEPTTRGKRPSSKGG